MKTYTQPGAKLLGALTGICGLLCAAGCLLLLWAPERVEWIVLCLVAGGLLGILFLASWLACAACPIYLDDVGIVFPITRAPRLRFRRNPVRYCEIDHVRAILHRGDGMRTKDTVFYRFVLKNGLEFTETLFSYGKTAEQEITEHLKQHTRFV